MVAQRGDLRPLGPRASLEAMRCTLTISPRCCSNSLNRSFIDPDDLGPLSLEAFEVLQARVASLKVQLMAIFLLVPLAGSGKGNVGDRLLAFLRRVPPKRKSRTHTPLGGALSAAWLPASLPQMVDRNPGAFGLRGMSSKLQTKINRALFVPVHDPR